MNTINFSRINLNENIAFKKTNNIEDKSDLKKIDDNNIIIEDNLTISEEAKKLLKDNKDKALQEEALNLIENFKEEIKAYRDSENPYTVELKCLLISLRIINGDQVPDKDKSFLMEHKPDMYKNAILLKKTNKDPKKHKSLLEDKNEENLEDLSMETSELSSEVSTSPKDSQSFDT